jgi:hypothetical protein
MRRLLVVPLAALALANAGCMERRLARSRPRLGFGQEVRVGNDGFRNVDVLLMVDDSGSMEEEQDNLAEQIPRLIGDLVAPPDRDPVDGMPDWGAADRVRVVVVSSDVGTSGATPPRAIEEICFGQGDDGMARTSAACGAADPIQVFQTGDDPVAFANRVGCVVSSLGLGGCAIEQQLESAARHVDRSLPAGFPADDAIFAVLLLTDEDDCSLAQPDAFYAQFTGVNGNVLCGRAESGVGGDPSWLTAIPGLAARISAARDRESFVLAAITGIPVTASGMSPDDILRLPEMEFIEQIGPGGGLEPRPACESSLGRAFPARRITQLARLLPGSVLHSICTDDFTPAISDLVRRIAERLGSVCLTRAVPLVGDRVDCLMEETLPAGMLCSEVPGRVDHGVDEDGRAVCLVDQVPGGTGAGFFYDASDPECAQLEFTPGSEPPLGARITVDCYFEVPSEGGGPLGP